MAETNLKNVIYSNCMNPKLRQLFLALYETSTGHNHDGSNSKAVSVGTVGDGLVTNAKLATDVKVGSLGDLTTSETSSVVGSINEIVDAIETISGNMGTLSSLTTTAKNNLVVAINEVVASITGFASITGAETLTNKTLTTPVIDDTDEGCTITSANQTHSSATITIPNCGDAADDFVLKDTTQNLTNKTLISPVIDDTDEGCILTSADQTNSAPTVTIPNIGDAADTFAMVDTSQTLTNKTLTNPVVNAPDLTFGVSTVHDYSGGHGDWTLSAGELATTLVSTTNADQAVNAIATPTNGKVYIVTNGAGYALTFKASGQTGVEIATGKTAIVGGDGTDFFRITGDA